LDYLKSIEDEQNKTRKQLSGSVLKKHRPVPQLNIETQAHRTAKLANATALLLDGIQSFQTPVHRTPIKLSKV